MSVRGRVIAAAVCLAVAAPVAGAAVIGGTPNPDKLFGTKPWLTYIFTALGVAAAFVNLYKIGLRDSGGNE